MNDRLTEFFRKSVPKNRCLVGEWSVCNVVSRGDRRARECDRSRGTSRRTRLDMS